MLEIPVIITERLRLTALADKHFETYAAMLADEGTTRFVGDGQPLDRMNAWRSMAMLLGHWMLRGYGMWALELKETGEFVGRAGLHNPEGWPDLEIGWMLRPEFRHQGLATEAARAVLAYAFQRLGAERVISLIRIENSASERVARRLGGRQSTTIDFLGSATLVYTYHRPDEHG
ncbi:MAG TPA: GNAT family N-acetyltransferase [Dokdonella sp.]|uniref:GNAT family N-acetyltransferase n=1 Tax=Dokdonella sp. TaxID=2291710 RepID=UPI0025BDA990|nr:GNAT family N-acetyltransferase [Dokdonella sp.]MBX3692781.1 GNAT family N-acetyltransferase [Dokdonella sp.]MCW5567655.1 GNAT family N-acetyltransferase [Dokdonella sp.]HNR92635.1 GNAT family N-acetyltransferase [Dokdonella sp.]